MNSGRIVLENSVDQFTLLAYAADADAVLDVTGLDLRRLPLEVKASLYSDAAVFRVMDLRASADITANRAVVFLAPELRTAGNISATHAELFETPQLQTAGNIHATSAGEFVARELVTAGDICVFGATNFEAQSLQRAGYINAYSTKCFRALQLCECGMLRIPCVRIFVAPQLRSASVVDACSATWIIVPLLDPALIFAPRRPFFNRLFSGGSMASRDARGLPGRALRAQPSQIIHAVVNLQRRSRTARRAFW